MVVEVVVLGIPFHKLFCTCTIRKSLVILSVLGEIRVYEGVWYNISLHWSSGEGLEKLEKKSSIKITKNRSSSLGSSPCLLRPLYVKGLYDIVLGVLVEDVILEERSIGPSCSCLQKASFISGPHFHLGLSFFFAWNFYVAKTVRARNTEAFLYTIRVSHFSSGSGATCSGMNAHLGDFNLALSRATKSVWVENMVLLNGPILKKPMWVVNVVPVTFLLIQDRDFVGIFGVTNARRCYYTLELNQCLRDLVIPRTFLLLKLARDPTFKQNRGYYLIRDLLSSTCPLSSETYLALSME
ncbi:hypothetical protein VNO77_08788 [Canavalia gladiata]|uniref:Uncharacterized protein n=1 Tax=Canavalia gladiata TaxID=3824 RepID=A0AAN9ME54_CANGL